MADLTSLLQDNDFKALPDEVKLEGLREAVPGFVDLPIETQRAALADFQPPAPIGAPATTGAPDSAGKMAFEATVDAMPVLGMLAGGLAGPLGGLGAAGTVGMAGVGGAGGEAWRQNVRNALGWGGTPQSSGDAALSIGREGLKAAAGEVGGQFVGKGMEMLSSYAGRGITAETKAALDAADAKGIPTLPPTAEEGMGSRVLGWLTRGTGASYPSRLLKKHYGQKFNDAIIDEEIAIIREHTGAIPVAGVRSASGAFKADKVAGEQAVKDAFQVWEESGGGPNAMIPVPNLRKLAEEMLSDPAIANSTSGKVVTARLKLTEFLTSTPAGIAKIQRINTAQNELGRVLYEAGVKDGTLLVQAAVTADSKALSEAFGDAYTAARATAKDKRLFDTIYSVFSPSNRYAPVVHKQVAQADGSMVEVIDVSALGKAINGARGKILNLAGKEEGGKIVERLDNLYEMVRRNAALSAAGRTPVKFLGPLEGAVLGIGGGTSLAAGKVPSAPSVLTYVIPAGGSVALTKGLIAPRGALKSFLTGRWTPPQLGRGVAGTVKAALPRVGGNMALGGMIPLKADDE